MNGNLYSDPYKKITSAKYYYHNNPKDLTINSNFLKFTYDASGTKLRKQVLNSLSQQILKQDYVSGIEYRNDTIEAIYHSDGRSVWNGSAWRYEYNVADHLGNVRAVISDLDGDKILDFTGVATTNEIINVNSYYAFGMVMQNGNFANNTTTPDTKYQYNNKEFNGDWGLNLLDYGARWYDPAVGRFTTVDPLAEDAVDWTPFRYGFNNPILYTDPDGMFETKDAAEKYAADNKIKTGFLRDNKIVENGDGTYSIDNKKTNSSTQDFGGEIGVKTGGLVAANDVINHTLKSTTLRDGTVIEMQRMEAIPLGGGQSLNVGRWIMGALLAGGIVATSENITKGPAYVYSKGGKQNIWPDYYPKPIWKEVDWSKSDGTLADEISNSVGDTKTGPGSDNNKAKKVFRDHRPKNNKK